MNYIILDIETTGLDVKKSLPIQLAYEVHNEHIQKEKGSFYLKPEILVSEEIEKITGITNKMLFEQGISMLDGVSKYSAMIWRHQPCLLIGYNILNFDFPIIQNWLQEYVLGKFKHPPVYGILDVMQMASIHFKTRHWLKLSEAGRKLGVVFASESLHNAEIDVNLTWQIFEILEKIK